MSENIPLTVSEVARRLQLNERTVTMWLRNGRLRGHKIGKEWRVSGCDLEVFLEKNANKESRELVWPELVALRNY